MCGRYVTKDQAAIEAAFRITRIRWNELRDSYNVAPSQQVPVVRTVDGEREGITMHWGLIPAWAKGEPTKYATINATVENIETGRLWRSAWSHARRCIFPVSGFYEWHLNTDKSKQPYYITCADQDVFGFAGLWEDSINEAGISTLSCAIITLPANPFMAEIHNTRARMPAVLSRDAHDSWLCGTTDDARAVLQPYPQDLMVAYKVSKKVNIAKNNSPDLILAI